MCEQARTPRECSCRNVHSAVRWHTFAGKLRACSIFAHESKPNMGMQHNTHCVKCTTHEHIAHTGVALRYVRAKSLNASSVCVCVDVFISVCVHAQKKYNLERKKHTSLNIIHTYIICVSEVHNSTSGTLCKRARHNEEQSNV